MTPVDFAHIMARSDDRDDRALAVAIITRSLTDDDPATLRQGWPLNRDTVEAAARYVRAPITDALVADVLALAPTLSDAILNKVPR